MISCDTRGHHVRHPDDGCYVVCGDYDYSNMILFSRQPRKTILKGTAVMKAVNDTKKSPLEDEIRGECNDLADFLVDKNRKYGNSALQPVRIFSQSDVLEQLRVRIDDKLSRIQSAQLDDDEDVINDLIGYFILYRIAKKNDNTKNQ